jgi:hypothetical protein
VIEPGEHRVYLAFDTLAYSGLAPLVRVLGPSQYDGYYRVECPTGGGHAHAEELLDPNDARGYPPLEEDATEAPPT